MRREVAVAVASAALGAWLAVVVRGSEKADAAAREIEPDVAVAADGGVCVAWMAVRGEGARHVGVKCSRDGGAQWSERRIGESAAAFVADPRLAAAPDGAFWIAWLSFRMAARAAGEPWDMHVLARRLDATLAIDVTAGDDARFDRPALTIDARGRVLVAYRREAPGESAIVAARSDDGSQFDRAVVAGGESFLGMLPAVCMSGGRAYVAWMDPLEGVVIRRSDDRGERWGDSTVVSLPGDNVAFEAPACVAQGDEVRVVYGIATGPIDTGSSAVLASLVAARSLDGGRTFPSRVLLSEAHPMMHPAIVRDDDGAIEVVYYADGFRMARLGDDRAETLGVLRSPVAFAPRRDDPAWPGDYAGFARGAGTGDAWAAFVDRGRVVALPVSLRRPAAP